MVCTDCGLDSQHSDGHCGRCGAHGSLRCPYCGYVGLARASFCGSCGRHFKVGLVSETIATDLGTLRHCTVLFADLVRSTEIVAEINPEEAMDRLRYYIVTMQNSIERFGGSVIKSLGDGVLAIFGAPVAHEGHAILACEAALDILKQLRMLGVGIAGRVGAHSGDIAFVPLFQADSPPEVHGLTVHVASRIAALADPGAVFVSAECARLANSGICFAPLGAHVLKGVPNPVELFAVEQSLPAGADKPHPRVALQSFVGRETELSALKRVANRSGRDGHHVFGISGSGGTGKSRLCNEFITWCRGCGISAFEVRVLLYGHATPLQAILDLMRTVFFHISPDDTVEAGRQKVRRTLGAAATADDCALIFEVLGLGQISRSPLEARTRRDRLLSIFRNLAVTAGRSPWGGRPI